MSERQLAFPNGGPAAAAGDPPARRIVVQGVSKVFSGAGLEITALVGIDLAVEQGQFVSILGPSGCGKSTLLRIVGGLLPPSSGTVAVNGKSPAAAQRNKEIGFVFQSPALLPWRTVLQNVELPLEVNRAANRAVGPSSAALLDLVGLGAFRDSYPHQLSGGMQQRVAIARALVFSPDILLMDEPFGALDEITRAAMRYELLRIWEQATSTVVFVTHSIAEAIILSDFVVVVARQPGRIREVVPIDLPRPRDEAMEYGARFLEYAAHLKGLLR
jgi:NitT/TauT family transport system ATP-binding protein